jgi:hypothetical protein
VYKNVKRTAACNTNGSVFIAETCSKDTTCLNKGYADIVAYKGVFIYFIVYIYVVDLYYSRNSHPCVSNDSSVICFAI